MGSVRVKTTWWSKWNGAEQYCNQTTPYLQQLCGSSCPCSAASSRPFRCALQCTAACYVKPMQHRHIFQNALSPPYDNSNHDSRQHKRCDMP
eukprot:686179-Rhodomonas_salina.2